MIETSQLQTLVAVAEAKSFSKAAEKLQVTQSAISQSIKNLEKKIGVVLFKRLGKRVVLTSEGEKLHSLASDFTMKLDETLDEIQHGKDNMRGRVRIGTLNGVGKSWLSGELIEFSKEFPELSIQINLGFQEDLVRDFKNYRLDLLILPEDSVPSEGEKVLLSEEMSTLVFPKSFPVTQDMSLFDINSLPTILFEQDDPLYYRWCLKKFGELPKSINTKFTVNSHGNMLQAVYEGLGVAVIPNHVLNRSYFKDMVETIGPSFEVSNGRFYIVYHKDAYGLLRIKKTLERLTKSTQALNVPPLMTLQ